MQTNLFWFANGVVKLEKEWELRMNRGILRIMHFSYKKVYIATFQNQCCQLFGQSRNFGKIFENYLIGEVEPLIPIALSCKSILV